MKRIVCVMLTVVLCLGLCACGGGKEPEKTEEATITLDKSLVGDWYSIRKYPDSNNYEVWLLKFEENGIVEKVGYVDPHEVEDPVVHLIEDKYMVCNADDFLLYFYDMVDHNGGGAMGEYLYSCAYKFEGDVLVIAREGETERYTIGTLEDAVAELKSTDGNVQEATQPAAIQTLPPVADEPAPTESAVNLVTLVVDPELVGDWYWFADESTKSFQTVYFTEDGYMQELYYGWYTTDMGAPVNFYDRTSGDPPFPYRAEGGVIYYYSDGNGTVEWIGNQLVDPVEYGSIPYSVSGDTLTIWGRVYTRGTPEEAAASVGEKIN